MGNSKKLLKSLIFGAKPLASETRESPNKLKSKWILGKASSCINPADDVNDFQEVVTRNNDEDTSVPSHDPKSCVANSDLQSETTVEAPNREILEPNLGRNVENHKDPEVSSQDKDADGKIDEERAAVIIQAAFRKFLGQRAFKVMKNSIRHQEEQAKAAQQESHVKETQNCVQNSDSVKVKCELRSRKPRLSSEEGKTVPRQLKERHRFRANNGRVQDEWDHSPATYDELQAKIQSKHEAAARREKALAYASLQQLRVCNSKKNQTIGWSWLERWMAARPVESCAEALQNAYLDSEQQEIPQYGKIRKKSINNRRAPSAVRLAPYDSSTVKLTPSAKSTLSRVESKSDSDGQDSKGAVKALARVADFKSGMENKDDADQYEESCGSNVVSLGSPRCESSNSSLDSKLVKNTLNSSCRFASTKLQAPQCVSRTRSSKAKS